MADSTIEVTPGSGEEVAFSSLGGALGKAQVVKVNVGADGASVDFAQPLTDTQIRATALPVSGTFFQATQPVSGTFWQATQPVSGTFWQATQPVSGPLTDVQLRAVAVPVSGPLTDTELRATAVPVSGTVAVTHAALTELAAAINASSQMDVNLAASVTLTVTGAGGTFPVTGTFWQATQPVSGTFWQATQPISGTVTAAAGTNLIGKISASPETTTIYDGTTALTPKFAIIDHASSGDNTLVAAVNPKKLRVHQLYLHAAAAVIVRFESGAGGTALTGQMNIAANGGFVLPFSPMGWFETASNTLLNLELSGAVSVDGVLGYTEV